MLLDYARHCGRCRYARGGVGIPGALQAVEGGPDVYCTLKEQKYGVDHKDAKISFLLYSEGYALNCPYYSKIEPDDSAEGKLVPLIKELLKHVKAIRDKLEEK